MKLCPFKQGKEGFSRECDGGLCQLWVSSTWRVSTTRPGISANCVFNGLLMCIDTICSVIDSINNELAEIEVKIKE